MDYKMVAPSFVTVILSLDYWSPSDYKILSIPFGPRVVLTKSATAIAPTKDCYIRKIKWNMINLKKIYKFKILAPKIRRRILFEFIGINGVFVYLQV